MAHRNMGKAAQRAKWNGCRLASSSLGAKVPFSGCLCPKPSIEDQPPKTTTTGAWVRFLAVYASEVHLDSSQASD